jgi:F-type H+-transporting ATPase subunit gamma
MMRLAEIQAHIGSMGELLDVVGAMRSLAGMRMQEAQRALPGIRRYAGAMAAAIADTLLFVEAPAPPHRAARDGRGLVLCMAEHGFVGGFNEHLIDAAAAALKPGDRLFVLGSRGAAIAEERRLVADWMQPMPSRCAAAPETVHNLSAALYRHVADGEIARVEVMFARSGQRETAAIERRLLLPLDLTSLTPRQARQAPLHNLDPVVLQEKLIAEYVFAMLTEAAVESIASENAARFAAMESAHDGVSRKLESLRHDARQARQSEITTELLDLVTGAEALSGRNPASCRREPAKSD